METALTGRAAAEAISLSLQLGNSNARFDGRRVLRALRTHAGRLRVGASMTLAVRDRFHVETPRRGPGTERRPGRVQRRAPATEAPGRPTATPEREDASHGV